MVFLIFTCFLIFFLDFLKLDGGIGTFYPGAMKRWKMVSRKERIPAPPTIPQNAKNSVSRFNSCHILRPTWQMFFFTQPCFLGILHLHLFVLVGNKGKEGKVLEEKWCCSCQVHHPDCCIKLLRTSIEMASGKNEPMLCPHKYPSIGEYSKPIQQTGNSREA